MADLDLDTMQNLDETSASFTQSFIYCTMQWGANQSITVGRNDQIQPAYQWNAANINAFESHTYYMALVSLVDTVFRTQIYVLGEDFSIGDLFFDTTPIADSYQFIRHPGVVGWQASFVDADAHVRSIRPSSMVFAEWQSAPLNSITPVRGARLYAQYAPHIQLFEDFAAIAGNNETPPNLALDTSKSISGQSYRLDIADPTIPGQGVISNVLTPLGDAVSGIVDFTNTEIEFSVWFPSAALEAGDGLSAYLLGEDENLVQLPLPRITADQWQPIVIYPPMLQSGRYQFIIEFSGPASTSFWLDEITVNERTITWSARPSSAAAWTPLQDVVNSDSTGVVFPEYGSALQVRAQAHRQDAAILGAPKVVPVYAQLGRQVWPEDVPVDPYAPTQAGGTLAQFWTSPASGSVSVGQTVTFNARDYKSGFSYEEGAIVFYNGLWYQAMASNSSAPTDTSFWRRPSTNPIISYQWAFGDGTGGNGDVVEHVYQAPSPLSSVGYPVSLTTVDALGTRTYYLANVVVS